MAYYGATTPEKNVTIYEINSVSEKIYHYTISPEIYTGYTGMWYCEDKEPRFAVMDLREPEVAIKVWDLDHDQDVTGQAIPLRTNITYRIDTNLYPALKYLYRPNGNPSDSFFTVKLTDPRGKNVPNIYTGSYGKANTVILPFDTNPFVSSSPYLWSSGRAWDHTARNLQGDIVYPPGTYTFTLNQNLNHMQESYAASGMTDLEGKTTSTATVTFLDSVPRTVATTPAPAVPTGSEVTLSVTETPVSPTATAIPTSIPVAAKTTYTPLPGWIAMLAVGIAGLLAVVRRTQ